MSALGRYSATGRYAATGRSSRFEDHTHAVQGTRPGSLLAHWPLAEGSGTVVTDEHEDRFLGTYSNVTLAQTGIGDGRTAALFNGSTSYANVFSAGLAAAFPTLTGTLSIWVKPTSAAIWTNGTAYRIAVFDVNASNRVQIIKAASNLLTASYIAGGTTDSRTKAGSTLGSDWVHIALTWDKPGDILHMYVNGIQEGVGSTSLGVWAGSIVAATLGAADLTPTGVWPGYLAHAALWNAVLTPAEMLALGRR